MCVVEAKWVCPQLKGGQGSGGGRGGAHLSSVIRTISGCLEGSRHSLKSSGPTRHGQGGANVRCADSAAVGGSSASCRGGRVLIAIFRPILYLECVSS